MLAKLSLSILLSYRTLIYTMNSLLLFTEGEFNLRRLKVGIISDTHGLLRKEVIDILKTCDYIIHGGDIDEPEVLDTLTMISPVFVVRGNNDKGKWANDLKREETFQIGGLNFYLVHDKNGIPKKLSDIHVIIYGHTHKYQEEVKQGILWLNPGSCGKKRFRLPLSMAIMEIEGESYEVRKIMLEL